MDISPPTMLNTFNYHSSSSSSSLHHQQQMFSTVLDHHHHQTPLHYRSSSQTMISSNGIPITTFEDISFSSYPKPKENGAVDDTEISIFDAQRYFSENTADPRYTKKKQQQQQQQDHPSPDNILRVSSVSSTDGYGRNFRTRSFNATPTASSEASWNSQTGLLSNPPGSVGVSLRNFSSDHHKKRSSAKKWFSGRKCCCTGMKSVEVKEATSDSSEHGGESNNSSNNNGGGKGNFSSYAKRNHAHKTAAPTMSSQRSSTTTDNIMEDDFPTAEAPRQRRISATGRTFVDGAGGFSFPILNNNTTSSSAQVINTIKPVVMKGMKTKKTMMEDPPRDSLEVFQPIPAASRPPSMDISASNRQHFNPGSPITRVANTDDDMESDASSDLFEIESFSTQTTSYPMYGRRDSLDDEAPTFNARRFASANNIHYGRRSLDEPPTPSVAATECYAPSEVSIDWSVTTAEGYDRASVSNFSISASEMGSAAFLRQRLQHQAHEEMTTVVGGGDSGKMMRKGNGGGGLMMMSCRQEKAVNVGPQPMKWVPEGAAPPYPMMHVGGRPPRANKPPMGSDHSARLSLAFAA